MLSLSSLVLAGVLAVNSVAILNEERFLARIGWGKSELTSGNGGQGSVKHQIINLISATRTLMRIPLIIINIVAILFLIVFG